MSHRTPRPVPTRFRHGRFPHKRGAPAGRPGAGICRVTVRAWLVLLFVATVLPGVAGTAHADGVAADPAEEPRWWAYDSNEATVPFPYVPEPIGSWVYDEVDRQVAQGNLTDLPVNSRPLARSLIAARVAAALRAGKHSVGLDRLARELAWELRMMGAPRPYPESRPMVSLGPPESTVKFNGLVRVGGVFEEGESPRIGPESYVGFNGAYWSTPGFALYGEYLITEVENSARLGDPIAGGTDFIYVTPRFGATWHGKWFEAWFGHDNVRWGPGRNGSLLAGGGSPPFSQLGYRIHLGTFLTASAVHGWLSQAEGRYAAMHRIEMNFSDKVRWGISEGVRYDGTSPDPFYLLNLVTYAAAERLLTAEGSTSADRDSLFRSNFNVSTDLLWRVSEATSLYGEIMVDDVKTDGSGPTRLGYQLGARWIHEGARRLTLQGELNRVYNYTYSVFYGRDFYHADEPLGYGRGPDVLDVDLWADLDLNVDWTANVEGFYHRTGQGNDGRPWCPEQYVDGNPYGVDCQVYGPDAPGGSVLSGVVEDRMGGLLGAVYQPRDNLRLEAAAGVVWISNLDHAEGMDETRTVARGSVSWRW